MLEGLVRTVEKLRERIRAHGGSIGRFEVRTRVSLIDPMLHALDWEVGDPEHVTVEKNVDEEGRPDYALLGAASKPVLLIEAKKLSTTSAKARQVISYVMTENFKSHYNVPFCAWTNGDVWNVFDIGSQTVVVDVQLSRDDPADCAFQLLGLWRRSLADGSLRTPVKLPAEKTTADKVRKNLRDRKRTEPSDDGRGTPEPDLDEGRSAGTLISFNATDGLPSSIAFPGERARRIGKQFELILSVANYLVRTERLTRENGTLPSGPKRYIVHSKPEHPTGSDFVAPAELENGLYLETSNPLAQTVKYARRLLEHYGEPGLAAQVKLGR